MCDLLRIIGSSCGSTGLALSMHQHLIAANVWKFRLGKGGSEVLKLAAEKQPVLVSTGARDWLESNGELTKTEGGFSFRPENFLPVSLAAVTSLLQVLHITILTKGGRYCISLFLWERKESKFKATGIPWECAVPVPIQVHDEMIKPLLVLSQEDFIRTLAWGSYTASKRFIRIVINRTQSSNLSVAS